MPKYKMDQRSDGFKQFISILLNLSIENKIKGIKNRIILLDEPEVHLHPSGIKYLRDELLSIAKNNVIFISTHSIYLVDKLHLDRHFKVSKTKSITEVKQIEKGNPYEEEIIYESLGTSIYEMIEPNMLVFEGKTDKDIFDTVTKKFNTEFKPARHGSISADGVDKIPQYAKFMDGKFVRGFIVVDSDPEGSRIKQKIINDFEAFDEKKVFEINDLVQTDIHATMEDLLPKELIHSVLGEKFKVQIDLNDSPVVKQIEAKNKSLGGKINMKDLKSFLADSVISDMNNLNKKEIKEKYGRYLNFVEKLHEKINT